ncbi:MAG: hypothetical protein R2736_20375, partial [Solirubrobacterales bacterium]
MISGTVTAETMPQGLAGARVEGWDAAGELQKPLVTGIVRPGGGFNLVLAESVAALIAERQIRLDLRVVYQGALLRLDKPVTWSAGQPGEGLVLTPRLGPDGRDPDGARTVHGTVTGRDGRPAADLLVQASDRDLRAEELLGEARTGRDGRYAIAYTARSYARAEKAAADLVVRVIGAGGETLYEPAPEDVLFNAAADVRHDIRLVQPFSPARSEYEALASTLAPLLGDVAPADLAEDEEHRDVTFLSREAGAEARRIEHFAVAHR